MLDCREVLGSLGRFVDDELSPQEAAAIEDHLRDCPACQRELKSLRLLSASLEASSPPPVPAGLLGDVMQAVRDETPVPRLGVLEFWKPWPTAMRLAAAGAAAAACIVGLLLASAAVPSRSQGRGEMAWVEWSAGSEIAQAYVGQVP
jgi:anti-sigma factor RsiW